MLGFVLVLAIDTSTPTLVTGVVRDGRTLAQVVISDCRDQNEQLTPATMRMLADAGVGFADLDVVVVGAGPGPFTGLRVGMSTAQAFADALNIPVYGVCSLDAIAQALDKPALITTDARRKEVYWAAYDNNGRVAGPDVVKPEELTLPDGFVPAVTNVPAHLSQRLGVEEFVDLCPMPEHLVAVARLDVPPEPLVPLYLRRPDAKEPAAKPRSAAIPDVEL